MQLTIFTQAMAAMTAVTNDHALYTRVVRSASKLQQDDIACMDEAVAFLDCVGDECISCVLDAVADFDETTTCADLKGTSFCSDIFACAVGSCAHVEEACDDTGDALEDCVEANYPEVDGEEDPECDDLCDDAADEKEAMEVFSQAMTSFAASTNNVALYNRAMAGVSVQQDEDIACFDEAMDLLECIGDECLGCIGEALSDFDMTTTCADLAASTFCDDIEACGIGSCAHYEAECTALEGPLETCVETNYPPLPEGETDPACDTLCEVDTHVEAVSPKEVFTQAMTGAVAFNRDMALYNHAVSAVSTVDDDEVACMDEAVDFLECVGDACIGCILAAVEDFDETTTCGDLAADTDFCNDIFACATGSCSHVEAECTDDAVEFLECVEDEYPPEPATGEVDPDCETLCAAETTIFKIA